MAETIRDLVFLFLLIFLNGCNVFMPESLDDEINQFWIKNTYEKVLRSDGIERAKDIQVILYNTKTYNGRKNDLRGWQNSLTLFQKICTDILKIPAANIKQFSDVGARGLEALIAPTKYDNENSLRIVYFSSHHLKNGKLMLTKNEIYTSKKLFHKLSQYPGKTLLIFDTCYARNLDNNRILPPRLTVWYASDKEQIAYDLQPKNGLFGVKKYLINTSLYHRNYLGEQARRYSAFCYLFLHALLRVRDNSITLERFHNKMLIYNNELTDLPGMAGNSDIFLEGNFFWKNIKLKLNKKHKPYHGQ